MTKVSSAKFQRNLSLSYIILSFKRLEHKQCSSRWGGSSWATSSSSTLFANSAIFIICSYRVTCSKGTCNKLYDALNIWSLLAYFWQNYGQYNILLHVLRIMYNNWSRYSQYVGRSEDNDYQILVTKWRFSLGTYHISLVIRKVVVVFSFQNNTKNLDPSYKMDLDFWDCLGRIKHLLQQNCKGLI